MDECALYLIEALEYTDAIVDISLADSFFENSAEAQEINDRNEAASQGAIASIKKAFQKLINAIKTLIKNFTDFIKNKLMTKSQKDEYKKVKAEIRSNPELAKEEVTIEDFSQYEKIYDDALKEINNEMLKPEPDPQKIPTLMETMSNKIRNLKGLGGDVAKRAAVVVPLKLAVDIADKNVLCAQAISAAMNSELVSLEQAEKILGDKQVVRYKKKIEKYAKNGIFHRAKAKILNHKQATLKSVLTSQVSTILSFTNLDKNRKLKDGKPIISKGSVVKGAIKNPRFTSDIVGGPKGVVKASKTVGDITDTIDSVAGYSKSAKRMAKDAEKNLNDFRTFVGLNKK